MNIPLAAPRSAAAHMRAAAVGGSPGERRDVDVIYEILDLRLSCDVFEFENHVNGHIKSLLVILNEMLPTTLNQAAPFRSALREADPPPICQPLRSASDATRLMPMSMPSSWKCGRSQTLAE